MTSLDNQTPALPKAGGWSANRIFAFLFGFLPFAVVLRFPPNSGFWGQWALVTAVLLWLVLRPRARPRWTGGVVACAAVALWLLVQAAMGLSPMPAALLVSVAVLGIAAWACASAGDLGSTPQGDVLVTGFAWGLLAAFALNAVAVAFELAGYEWIWIVVFKVNERLPRAVGLIGQANHLGVLAVYAGFAALTLRSLGRMPGPLLWLVVAAASVVCAASASRVALVVWAACMALTFVWWRGSGASHGVRLRVEGVIAAVLFAVVQVAWVAHDHSRGGQEAQLTRSADVGRVSMLHDAGVLWLRHPLIGVGQGNYAAQRLHELDSPLRAPHSDHAHNLFAHAAAEWGVVGLFTVAAAFAYTLWVLLRRLRDPARRPVELLPAVWILGVALHSLVEQPLWFATFLLPFALMLGWLTQATLRLASVAEGAAHGGAKLRPPRWILVGMVVIACGMTAADFARLQVLAMKILAEGPGMGPLVNFEEMARAESLTMFPRQAKVMLSRKLPLGDAAADAKIMIARQAMDAVPSPETIARWAAFCALGGRAEEARTLFTDLAVRNAGYRAAALELLNTWATLDPRIARLNDELVAEHGSR
jgi:O-antigen ligase